VLRKFEYSSQMLSSSSGNVWVRLHTVCLSSYSTNKSHVAWGLGNLLAISLH
jgi:hypothetical protein